MTRPRAANVVTIVGAGLAGALLALLLAQRGYRVRVLEKRPDPRDSRGDSGRSINLALAERGIAALRRAGLMDRIADLLIPMRGRMVHDIDGASSLQPYGQTENEVIHSVDRAALNVALLEQLQRQPAVELRFEQACLGVRPAYGTLQMRDLNSNEAYDLALAPTIATDGAGSTVRASLAALGEISQREELLDHDYKELQIPAAEGRQLDRHALHIWPGSGCMLIALPNPDQSFTVTLFLARRGRDSFETLTDPTRLLPFFERQFPGARQLMPNLAADFAANPQGFLGTVHCRPWAFGGQAFGGQLLLLGDAAHAIVPFHGQGMNCAFEDCLALVDLLDSGLGWSEAFASFEQQRRPNTEAIARMALENYAEMRESVLEPAFQRQRQLALALERRYPDRFIPRYAMVMFHAGIPYAEAERRGAIQQTLLQRMDLAGLRAGDAAFEDPLAGYDEEITRLLPLIPAAPAAARE